MSLGKSMDSSMRNFRGDPIISGKIPGAVGSVSDPDNVLSREDFDRCAHQECAAIEEDMFLVRPIPSLLEVLPDMLRNCVREAKARDENHVVGIKKQFLERRKSEYMDRMEMQAGYFLPSLTERSLWGFGRLGLTSDMDRQNLILELLPALRKIGAIEEAMEFAAVQDANDAAANSNRRTTRRQAKARRHHYFDKLSQTLRRDEGDLNSSEVGSLLAKDLMAYSF
jgi:hypothetical protein